MKGMARMAKQCGIIFGLFGYFSGFYFYAPGFGVFRSQLVYNIADTMCLPCIHDFGRESSKIYIGLFLAGPLNALLYFVVGYLIGKVIGKFSRK